MPDELLKLVREFGIFVVAAGALYWAVFVPRKGKDGEKKSSLLVPGWQHDEIRNDAKAELDTQRRFYQKALTDCQEQADSRIQEFRGARDVAFATAADARADAAKLLDAITDLNRDVAVLLEVQRMAARDGSREVKSG